MKSVEAAVSLSRSVVLHRVHGIVLSAGVLLLVGCTGSADGPLLVPVSGTVTYGGQPVKNATVTFLPQSTDSGQSAQGTTDEAGKFTVGTASRTGLQAGSYVIRIEAWKVPLAQLEPSAPASELEANRAVPAKYFDGATSGLTLTVQEGDEPHDLKLELDDQEATQAGEE